jgi:hypothetical protein
MKQKEDQLAVQTMQAAQHVKSLSLQTITSMVQSGKLEVKTTEEMLGECKKIEEYLWSDINLPPKAVTPQPRIVT